MFHGSMVALVTPMTSGGEIDGRSLARLIDWHIESGTGALVAVGTTGESATLDFEEHCGVIRRFVELAGGRIPVIAGTGANATSEAIRLTRCAMEAGANACLLVTPYYNKPTQEGLYQHFKAIAEAVPIPQILYNVPARTAIDMQPETVSRLAGISNIVGIKEALGQVERIRALADRCGGQMSIYSGDDATARQSIQAGAKGVISVTANVTPVLMQAMCHSALQGDFEEARRIDMRLSPLHKALFLESNPIPVKWALHEMGWISDGIRLPLTWFSANKHDVLRAAMREAGISLSGESHA